MVLVLVLTLVLVLSLSFNSLDQFVPSVPVPADRPVSDRSFRPDERFFYSYTANASR